MRYVGIDYGTKKIGIAFSNEAGTMAFPYGVLPNDNELLNVLEALITEKEIDAIVIGHSIDLDGAENRLQADIDDLINDLSLRFGLPVHLEPEHYTTQEAMRIQGRTDQTDASAAALMLTSFLTKQANGA